MWPGTLFSGGSFLAVKGSSFNNSGLTGTISLSGLIINLVKNGKVTNRAIVIKRLKGASKVSEIGMIPAIFSTGFPFVAAASRTEPDNPLS